MFEIIRVEPNCFQLGDDAIDIARRVSFAHNDTSRAGVGPGTCRNEAMRRQPADDEIDVRQSPFQQRGFGIRDLALCGRRAVVGGGGGDEAVLAQQGDDEGHAGDGAFLDEGVEAGAGGAFRGGGRRGVGVGDVARLLEVDDVGVDDGAHGVVLGT